MPNLPTFSELFRVGRDEILARESRLSKDVVEREGSDANVLVAAEAAVGDQLVGQLGIALSGLFLSSAKRSALDRYVWDRYQLARKPASASVGSVVFRTATPASLAFAIPQNVIVQSTSGVQFVTTEASAFFIGATSLVVTIRSVLAGSEQKAKIGTITSIVSPIPGAPRDLTCTNTIATSGGDDAESDDAYRSRAKNFFSTARKGTNSALELAAKSVGGVRTATTFETIDAMGRPSRMVSLIIADAYTDQFADLSTIPPKYETQSQQLAALVSATLQDVRPCGVYVQVIVANVILVPFQLSLSFLAGADINTSSLEARAAIVNCVNSLSPGKQFIQSEALNKLKLVSGLKYTGNEIVSPPGNIIPKPLQVLRTTLGIVCTVSAQTNTPIITGSNPDRYI
jgi:uncharacterized phage protein gp47/JayE